MIVYWHKKDLRFLDNLALQEAISLSKENKAVFLPILGFETNLVENPVTEYEFAIFWQYGYLAAALPLYKNYEFKGIKCGLYNSPILEYLESLHDITPITYLISHQENGTYGTFERDKKVAEYCKFNNIIWKQFAQNGVSRKKDAWVNHTQKVRDYLSEPLISTPIFDSNLQVDLKKQILSNNDDLLVFFNKRLNSLTSKYSLRPTSEKNAIATMIDFATNRASRYRGGISSPNTALEHGARLSQYLAFGSISHRYIKHYYTKRLKIEQNKWLNLGVSASQQRQFWREHCIQRLESKPTMPINAVTSDFDAINYTHDADLFLAFKTGKTGEPLIDACMRCLLDTGFINFRMRAMLVSYAVFGLDLNWREVGRFMATVFLDYVPGLHWSQVQMQAGVLGMNAINIFTPSKQLLDHDPKCIFVKKWIPELCDIEIAKIINYEDLDTLTNSKYPNTIVEFVAVCKINKAKTYELFKTLDRNIYRTKFPKRVYKKKNLKNEVVEDKGNTLF